MDGEKKEFTEDEKKLTFQEVKAQMADDLKNKLELSKEHLGRQAGNVEVSSVAGSVRIEFGGEVTDFKVQQGNLNVEISGPETNYEQKLQIFKEIVSILRDGPLFENKPISSGEGMHF